MADTQLDTRVTSPLIALGFIVAGLGLCLLLDAQIGWAVAAAAVLWMMLMGRPRRMLGLYWIWVLLYPLGSLMVPTPLLKWVDEMLLASLLAVLLLHQILHYRGSPGLRGFGRALGLLTLLIVASALANQAPKVGVMHFCLQYMRSFLLFYYTLRFFEPKDARLFYYGLAASLLIQLGLNSGWMLGINPLPNRSRAMTDFAVGSLDACNLVAYIAIAVFCSAIALHHLAPRRTQRTGALVLAALALFQVHITYTFHALALLAACFAYQFLDGGGRWRGRVRTAVATIAGVLLLGVLLAALRPGNDGLRRQLDLSYLSDRMTMMVEGPKGRAYREVVMTAPHDMPAPLLGAGPGNFGSMVGRMNRRPLAEQYINYLLTAVDVISETQGFSITSGPNTGFIALWSELGPFGFILYWGLHVFVMLRVRRQNRRKAYRDPHLQALADAFVPAMGLWLVLSAIVDYNYIPYLHGGLWIWAAAVWRSDQPAAAAEPLKPVPAAAAPARRAPRPRFFEF